MLLRNIPSDSWVSVNSLLGIPIGTRLDLTNQGQAELIIFTSETQPLVSFKDGKLLKEVESEQSRTTLRATSEELWVRSNTSVSDGILLVQPNNYPFTDFGGDLDPRVYTGYQGLTIQPFTEANVKNGTQFALTYEFESIASGDKVYLAFTTPNNTNDTLIKTRIINTNGGMRYKPYGGATFTTTGSPVPIENLNKRSSNISQVIVNNVDPLSVNVATATSFDIVRSTEGVGSNRQQGIFEGLGIERVLDRNSPYLLEFENLDTKAIYVVFSVTWYEGPLSPDII